MGLRSTSPLRDIFGFCQVSGGLYHGRPNDTMDARQLKTAAAAAKGRHKATILQIWNRLSLSILGSHETIQTARYS